MLPALQVPVDLDVVAAQVRRLVEGEQIPGLTVDVLVTESPDVHGEILAQADRRGADLIVLGTHGRGGVERLLLGSIAERVLRKSRCPVVTVPMTAPEAMPRGPAPFARIVCGIDFSPSAQLGLDHAMSLAVASKGTLVLVHAIEVLPLYYDFSPPVVVDLDAWRKDALQRLHAMVPGDVRTSCEVREVVVRGKPYQGILELAETTRADLIVLGIQGRGALDRFFFGSTANHVVRQAGCAVMTVRS
jgi:nucleotide-binding universal stress UspA family protein